MSTPHQGGPAPDVGEPGDHAGLTESASDAADANAYLDVGDWVQEWCAPTIAVRLSGGDTGRGLTWCAQWWTHQGVAIRLQALWQAWETARRSQDTAAMSTRWTNHADPHLRTLLARQHGPQWRCSSTQHHPIPHLPVMPSPPGWFNSPTAHDGRPSLFNTGEA